MGRAPVRALRLVLDVQDVRPILPALPRARLPPLCDHSEGVLGQRAQPLHLRLADAPRARGEVRDLAPAHLSGQRLGVPHLGGNRVGALLRDPLGHEPLVPAVDLQQRDDEEHGVQDERDGHHKAHEAGDLGPLQDQGLVEPHQRRVLDPGDGEERQQDLEDGPAEEEGVVPGALVRERLVERVVEDKAQHAPPHEPHGRDHKVAEEHVVVVRVGVREQPDQRREEVEQQEEHDVEAVEEHELRYLLQPGGDVRLDVVAEDRLAGGPVLLPGLVLVLVPGGVGVFVGGVDWRSFSCGHVFISFLFFSCWFLCCLFM